MKAKELIDYLASFEADTDVALIVADVPARKRYPVKCVTCIVDAKEPFIGVEVGKEIPFDEEMTAEAEKDESMITVERAAEFSIDQSELQIGDEITFGEAKWRVLDIEDGKALIWMHTNVKDHVFNDNNSNVYEGSDIQKYLRTEFRDEVPEEIRDEEFFLLTEEQIRKYMPNGTDRTAVDEEGYDTWYWTGTPSVGNGSYVRLVGPTGHVSGLNASYSHGVTPACWINL